MKFKIIFSVLVIFIFTGCAGNSNDQKNSEENDLSENSEYEHLFDNFYVRDGWVVLGNHDSFKPSFPYGTDPETLERLEYGLYKDKNSIYQMYYTEFAEVYDHEYRKLEDLNPNNFTQFSDVYFQSDDVVYFLENLYGVEPKALTEIDTESFGLIENCYIKDKNGIYDYWTQKLVTNEPPENLTMYKVRGSGIGPDCYLNDGKNVYSTIYGHTNLSEEYDPATFRVVDLTLADECDYSIKLDKDTFKFEFTGYELVDGLSFQVLEDNPEYVAEDDFAYYRDVEMEDYFYSAHGPCFSSLERVPK